MASNGLLVPGSVPGTEFLPQTAASVPGFQGLPTSFPTHGQSNKGHAFGNQGDIVHAYPLRKWNQEPFHEQINQFQLVFANRSLVQSDPKSISNPMSKYQSIVNLPQLQYILKRAYDQKQIYKNQKAIPSDFADVSSIHTNNPPSERAVFAAKRYAGRAINYYPQSDLGENVDVSTKSEFVRGMTEISRIADANASAVNAYAKLLEGGNAVFIHTNIYEFLSQWNFLGAVKTLDEMGAPTIYGGTRTPVIVNVAMGRLATISNVLIPERRMRLNAKFGLIIMPRKIDGNTFVQLEVKTWTEEPSKTNRPTLHELTYIDESGTQARGRYIELGEINSIEQQRASTEPYIRSAQGLDTPPAQASEITSSLNNIEVRFHNVRI